MFVWSKINERLPDMTPNGYINPNMTPNGGHKKDTTTI
jgi:hypothetical protein